MQIISLFRYLEDFSFLEGKSFPLIKALGSCKEMKALEERLQKVPGIQATYIQDPLARGKVFLNLITQAKASKGAILQELRKKFPEGAIGKRDVK